MKMKNVDGFALIQAIAMAQEDKLENEKMKIELENEDFECGIISYERDNEEIVLNFSFNVTMSLKDARILGGMQHKNTEDIRLRDYFSSAREGALKDKWKITVELKDFEKEIKLLRKKG